MYLVKNPKNYKITKRNGGETKEQYQKIVDTYKGTEGKKIVLCDDGIFSGDTLKNTIENFKEIGINIDEILVGLNFSNGDQLNFSKDNSIPIKSMNKTDSEKCYDWIDERDFFYGTPMSGASVLNGKGVYGVPYISTQKIAQEKASIPVKISEKFCKGMLKENKELRDRIGDLRGSPIKLGEINRVKQLLNKYRYSENIVDVLNKEEKNI